MIKQSSEMNWVEKFTAVSELRRKSATYWGHCISKVDINIKTCKWVVRSLK